MTFGPHAGNRGARTRAEIPGRVGPVDRRGQKGKTASFCYQEAVSGNTQAGVMMKSSPTAAFVIVLIPVLVSALDPVQ